MGSGQGWSTEESVAACKAYIAASEDPSSGSGKKKEVFRAQVLTAYTQLMCEERNKRGDIEYGERSGEAIIQRHRKARCEAIKFEGIVAAIMRRKPTGSPTVEDITRTATAIYNGEGTISNMYTFIRDSSLDYGSPFSFMDCLTFFRTTQSWSLMMNSKEQTASVSRVESVVNEDQSVRNGGDDSQSSIVRGSDRSIVVGAVVLPDSPPSLERPVGSKRFQELKKQASVLKRGADGIEKMADASQKRKKVAQQLLEVEKQQYMMQLFSMPGTDQNLRKRFMIASQRKGLESLEDTDITSEFPLSSIGDSQRNRIETSALVLEPVPGVSNLVDPPPNTLSSLLN